MEAEQVDQTEEKSERSSATTAVIERLQAKGERITLPRRLVIEALGGAHHHQTIADIQEYMRGSTPTYEISDTTIYRVLQWLKDLAEVSQTDMGRAGVVYALISVPYHHHLICLNCGMTTTIDDQPFAALREQFQRDYGFSARTDHMAIYGLCKNCAPAIS